MRLKDKFFMDFFGGINSYDLESFDSTDREDYSVDETN